MSAPGRLAWECPVIWCCPDCTRHGVVAVSDLAAWAALGDHARVCRRDRVARGNRPRLLALVAAHLPAQEDMSRG